ncbi:MAG: hypothetical protein LBV36_04070 [Chromatiales bacterium]|nr:hypothetical protein [Chromatiales bacterium]
MACTFLIAGVFCIQWPLRIVQRLGAVLGEEEPAGRRRQRLIWFVRFLGALALLNATMLLTVRS